MVGVSEKSDALFFRNCSLKWAMPFCVYIDSIINETTNATKTQRRIILW